MEDAFRNVLHGDDFDFVPKHRSHLDVELEFPHSHIAIVANNDGNVLLEALHKRLLILLVVRGKQARHKLVASITHEVIIRRMDPTSLSRELLCTL